MAQTKPSKQPEQGETNAVASGLGSETQGDGPGALNYRKGIVKLDNGTVQENF